MLIRYDSDANALIIQLREGEYVESDEVAPNIVVDFDAEGTPLAIEILNARQVLGSGTVNLQLPLIEGG